MTTRMEDLKTWILARTVREKWLLFAIGLAFIYGIVNLILVKPLVKADKQTIEDISRAKIELQTVNDQIKTILTAVSQTNYAQMLSENATLQNKSKDIVQRLLNSIPKIVSEAEQAKIIKDILSSQGNVELLRIEKLPTESWIPKDLANADIPGYFKTIDKYTLQIQFQSNYFNTISFLQRVEKLPWDLYWDSLNYKVTEYPNAEITLKLHVLISPKSGA